MRGEADSCSARASSTPGGARAGGMPLWKYVANRFLTTVENSVMRHRAVGAAHGLPRVLAAVLLEVPLLRNSLDFSFDSEMLMQAAHFGFRFHEVPARRATSTRPPRSPSARRWSTGSRRC